MRTTLGVLMLFLLGCSSAPEREPIPHRVWRAQPTGIQYSRQQLILSQLPTQARHDIGYRNAWRLLTGLATAAELSGDQSAVGSRTVTHRPPRSAERPSASSPP